MWIILPRIGFFSVVQKPEDRAIGLVTVRARVRADLERLKDWTEDRGIFWSYPIEGTLHADYLWRVRFRAVMWGKILALAGEAIDYSNVKAETLATLGAKREGIYHRVWALLANLDERSSPTSHDENRPKRGPSRPSQKPRPRKPRPLDRDIADREAAQALLDWAEKLR